MVGLDVSKDPQDPRHRARNGDLGGTQQRDVNEPQLPGGVGRELRGQIGSGSEHDADQIGGRKIVAVQNLGHQLGCAGENRVAVIRVDLDGASHSAHGHESSYRLIDLLLHRHSALVTRLLSNLSIQIEIVFEARRLTLIDL
jgi:hypothetical protein